MKKNIEPKRLLYDVVIDYLNQEQIKELDTDLQKVATVKSDGRFVKIIFKHFDIEIFKNKPIHKEAILLYNYFKYDFTRKIDTKPNGLFMRYFDSIEK